MIMTLINSWRQIPHGLITFLQSNFWIPLQWQLNLNTGFDKHIQTIALTIQQWYLFNSTCDSESSSHCINTSSNSEYLKKCFLCTLKIKSLNQKTERSSKLEVQSLKVERIKQTWKGTVFGEQAEKSINSKSKELRLSSKEGLERLKVENKVQTTLFSLFSENSPRPIQWWMPKRTKDAGELTTCARAHAHRWNKGEKWYTERTKRRKKTADLQLSEYVEFSQMKNEGNSPEEKT